MNNTIDVKSAYPYGQILANISKDTTILELCRIAGVSDADRRAIALNNTAGATNAVEFCQIVYKLPPIDTVALAYLEQKKKTA